MSPPTYEPNPCYATVGGAVAVGWSEPVARLPRSPLVLAVDGPAMLDWDRVVADLRAAITAQGLAVELLDLGAWFAPWSRIVAATGSAALADDPDFDRLADGELGGLFRELPTTSRPRAGVLLAYGPGAALLAHDVLWYVDRPKRFAEADVVAGHGHNLGQRAGTPVTKRLFYIDWPLLDRHRDAIAARIDRFIDGQDLDRPTSRRRVNPAGDLAESGRPAVPNPPDVQHDTVGWRLGPAPARREPERAQHRIGVRADRPGERRPRRRCRRGRGAAVPAGGRVPPARTARSRRPCRVRHIVPDQVRLPGHRQRREPVRALPPEGRLHGRRLRLALPAARDLLPDGGGRTGARVPRPARRCGPGRVPPTCRAGRAARDAARHRELHSGLRGRGPPAVLRACRDAARQWRGKRRAGGQRNAVPLLVAVLRLAAARCR